MTETYGHRWTANFGESPDPDHAWAKHLAGVNGAQIANGLAALSEARLAWPPSAPEFRDMCLRVEGAPAEPQAWIEALSGKYSHDSVRVAALATGAYDLRTGKPNDKALRARFSHNYAVVLRRARNGKPLDGRIAKAISHEEKTPMQIQFAHSHREARDLITAQGLPSDPKQARALLLAKMGIKRESAACDR